MRILIGVTIFFSWQLLATDRPCEDKLVAFSHIPTYIGQKLIFEGRRPFELDRLIQEYLQVTSAPPYSTARKFGTTVYSLLSPTSLPGYPEVGSEDVAVILALGGSGARTASGKAFLRNAASLKKYGIALISIDFPFHASGPKHPKFWSENQFAQWIENVVGHYSLTRLPIFLLGHSFGSIVFQEVLFRQSQRPASERIPIAGTFLLSPGGNATPGLLKHYQAFRYSDRWQQMLSSNRIQMNRLSEFWAEGWSGDGGINGGFRSVKDVSPIEVDAPVHVLAAQNDEWSSPALVEEFAARFSKNSLELLPEANHISVLFKKEGRETLLTKRIIEAATAVVGHPIPAKKPVRGSIESFKTLISNARIFKRWLANAHQKQRTENISEVEAAGILKEFEEILKKDVVTAARENFEVLSKASDFGGDFVIQTDFIGPTFRIGSMPDDVKLELNENLKTVSSILSKDYGKIGQQDFHRLVNFLGYSLYYSDPRWAHRLKVL